MNDVQNDVLSDEQLDAITKELGDVADSNEVIQMIREFDSEKNYIPEDADDNIEFEDFEEVIGQGKSLEDIVDGIVSSNDEESINKLSGVLGETLTPAEVVQMLNICKRVRKGEKFSVYNALPQPMKNEILKQFSKEGIPAVDKQALSFFANMLIENFITEVIDVQASREIIDFNKSIAESLKDMPNIITDYSNYTRKNMEIDFIKKADQLEQEHPKAAQLYRDCAKAFSESYTYSRQNELLNKQKIRNRLLKDNCFYDKFCRDINTGNQRNDFNMMDIRMIASALQNTNHSIFEDRLNESDITSFVILTCKAFRLLNPNKVDDAMLMYFTVFNINNLVNYISEEHDEFTETIIINIKKLFNRIWEAENDSRRFELG